MHCKWCGMDSKDDKRCEWCGRPFIAPSGDQAPDDQAAAGVPPVTTAMPPSREEATTAIPPSDYDPAEPVPFNPRLTGIKPMKVEAVEIIPFEVRIEKYLGVMALPLAAGMAIAHYFPAAWLGPFLALLFASGLTLGSFRVIGYYDDEFFDVAILLAAVMVTGPVYATAVYIALCVGKRDWNFSLLGLMASYFVIRLAIGSAAHGFSDTVRYMLTFNVCFGFIDWSLLLLPSCVLIGGWITASFTRPLNE